jgi:hypothetical protein
MNLRGDRMQPCRTPVSSAKVSVSPWAVMTLVKACASMLPMSETAHSGMLSRRRAAETAQ